MAKPLFQDIVPPEKRSIKRVTRSTPPPRPRFEAGVPVRTKRYVSENPQPHYEQEEIISEEYQRGAPPPRRVTVPHQKRRGFPKAIIILIILLIIGGIGYSFISKVSGAWVIVKAKNETVSINATFQAAKSTTSTTTPLNFQTVTIARDGKLAITASGQEVANTKASGTIIIYNTTATAQRLVGNTRFETPKGLIFRISQAVEIPAQKGTVPGSIEAVVTADAIGPDYNVGLTDFTIPGFKGSPKYEQIYARSKTSMQGGFSGTRKKANDTEIKTAREKIRAELKNNLVREAEKDIPSGFVLPQNSYFIEYESLPDTNTDTGIQVNERATFHGFIFNRTALAQEISKKVGGKASGPTDLIGIDNLAFTLKTPTATSTNSKPWNESAISFALNGTTTLVSVIDNDKLKAELVGKPRNSLNAVLAAYPSITSAEVTMRPFWKKSFPLTPEEIFITVEDSQ